MGRKVHPLGFRLGIVQDWQAKWYEDTHYAESLQEDLTIRRAIQGKYPDAAISRVEIDRQAKEVTVTIYTARPGIVIGRGGQRVDELNSNLEKLTGKKVRLNIQEIRQAELDAFLVARTIADQIQRRIAYRRAMKQAIFRTMQAGAKGIRVSCSGRLGDAEIARRQIMHEGQVPLHTIRADIDYAFTEAHTTLGRIGVKVWIYKGEILPEVKEVEVEEAAAAAAAPGEEQAEVSAEAPALETPAEAVTEPTAPARARRRTAATAEAKPAKAPTEAGVTAEKPAPKRRKKATTEAEEKPQEAVAEEGAKETEAKAEEKPARTARKRSKQAEATAETPEAEASSVMDQEEKDAAT